MEIRNNLISHTDININSSIQKNHSFKKQCSMPYKLLSEILTTINDTGPFFNLATNKRIGILPENILALNDHTLQYVKDQHTIVPGNNSPMFMPLMEIPAERSNPKIVVTFENGSRHTGINEYQITVSPGQIFTMCQMYADLVSKLLNADKLNLVILVKCQLVKNILTFKFQILNILLAKPAIYDLNKKFSLEYNRKGTVVYAERYNEWYITSPNPEEKQFHVYGIYNAAYDTYNYEKSMVQMSLDEFTKTNKNLPLVFSINDWPDSGYKKDVWNTEFDNLVCEELVDDTSKLQLFIDDPISKYYWIMLSHLPARYKTDEESWKELIKSFRSGGQYKILFADFSATSDFANQFEEEWNIVENVQRVHHGYYFHICKESPGYDGQNMEFIKDYMESLLYSINFKIAPLDITRIVRMLYNGKFYMTNENKHELWWFYVAKGDDSYDGELYKWRQVARPYFISDIITEEIMPIFAEVKNKIDTNARDLKNHKIIITALDRIRTALGDTVIVEKVTKQLTAKLYLPHMPKRRDQYPDIIGAKNGILDLHLRLGQTKRMEPSLITGYSKYFITRSVRAKYIAYDRNCPYVRKWKQIYTDIIPEKDARRFIWFFFSTGLDQHTRMGQVLGLYGGGGNGKSVITDNTMELLEDYATKLSINILIAKNKGNGADEDLMQIKGKNIGFICETDEGDELITSRLKTLNEIRKTGRKLFESNSNFETNCTIAISSNHPLVVNDMTYGAWRRLFCYVFKGRFCADPDPECPNEKLADPSYETLVRDDPKMAEALLSIYVYKRLKFHCEYNSNINNVPKPTIDRYTTEYKNDQNKIANFLYSRLVRCVGHLENGKLKNGVTNDSLEKHYLENGVTYVSQLTMDMLVAEYKLWHAQLTNAKPQADTSVKLKFEQSRLAKFMKNEDGGRSQYLSGYRLLKQGEKKLTGEEYFI